MTGQVALSPEDLQKQGEEFKQQLLEQNKKFLGPIWKKFDTNKDGKLDQKECKGLVEASLKAQAQYMPPLLKDAMKNVIKQLSASFGQDLPAQQIDAMMSSFVAVIKEKIKELQKQSDDIADKLFKGMDADSDGSVTKEEFEKNYFKASEEAVDMSALMPDQASMQQQCSIC